MFATRYFSPISWAHSLTRTLVLGKGKRVAIYTDSKYAFLVLHVHAAVWKERATWPPEGPQSNMIKSLGSWRQSICPLRFQSPTVKDTKKRARKWHEGTKHLIRQLREQCYRTMTIGIATLVPQSNLPETPSYTEGETLKDIKIIWGGSKRRDSFFCLGTSNGSWLTSYMPSLI